MAEISFMKTATINFPSVFETAFGNTENSSKDQLNGIKVKIKDRWYLVGSLAKKGGINPGRITNTSPQEDDFEILFNAALVLLADKIQSPYSVTLGFPFSTYNAYKSAAEQFLRKRHFVTEHDSRTFNIHGNIKKGMFDIEKFEIIPEIVGCIIGLKKILNLSPDESFIAVSIGFGTVEGGLVTGDGLVHRTCFSSHGIRYAINNLSRELNQSYFLEMKNEHQLDDAFVKGSILANRKRIELRETRKAILHQYYKEVVSPLMKNYFTDLDLDGCGKIYLMGGGSYYQELVQLFQEEFQDFIPVEVAPSPENIASIGYLYNSLRISDNYPTKCAGIDLGNSTSIISYFESGAAQPAN